jgi:RNA polymerase sigma factor (sigma-70 family)
VQEFRERVQEALTKLTQREARLFELCYLFGWTTLEIAEAMGIKPQSVRRRKHAVTKKLRQLLQH